MKVVVATTLRLDGGQPGVGVAEVDSRLDRYQLNYQLLQDFSLPTSSQSASTLFRKKTPSCRAQYRLFPNSPFQAEF